MKWSNFLVKSQDSTPYIQIKGGENMFYKFSIYVLLLAISVSVPSLVGCGKLSKETEEFYKTYKVKAGTKIEVYNKNGDIDIHKWDKNYVEVHALKSTRHGKDELEKVKIEVNTNGVMVIETKYIKKNAKVSVNYKIKLPANVIVDQIDNKNGKIEIEGTKGDALVTNSNGRIEIIDVDGYVSAKTSNGNINITGTTGIFKAETSNGNIKSEISNVKTDVNITTSNGSIELFIRPNLNANIEAKTSNGKISVHDIQMVVSESSSNHLDGRIGDGGSKIYIKTLNGNIDLYKL